MDEKEVNGKIAKHLGIEEIRYYINDGSTIILVYSAIGSFDGNMPMN